LVVVGDGKVNRLDKLYGKVLEKNTFEQISKVLDKNNVPITEEVGFVCLIMD